MGDPGTFSVDPDDLDLMVADVEKCERALERLTTDLERQIARLHETWEGQAAAAQREAQEEWNTGLLAMRQALADLRAAARLAHGNYTRATATNVTMWEQVR